MYAPVDPLNEVEQVSYVIKKFDIFTTFVLLNKNFSKYQIHQISNISAFYFIDIINAYLTKLRTQHLQN